MDRPEEPPDPVEHAWSRVLERWDDPSAHATFQALSADLDRLADAGRRYRAIREGDDPQRAAEAAAHIDRLQGLAVARLGALKAPRITRNHPAVLLLAVLVGGGVILAALLLLRGV